MSDKSETKDEELLLSYLITRIRERFVFIYKCHTHYRLWKTVPLMHLMCMRFSVMLYIYSFVYSSVYCHIVVHIQLCVLSYYGSVCQSNL